LGKQDQIWAKIFCIPKNMHSRTLMTPDKLARVKPILIEISILSFMFDVILSRQDHIAFNQTGDAQSRKQ